jgi:hypothetical protein
VSSRAQGKLGIRNAEHPSRLDVVSTGERQAALAADPRVHFGQEAETHSGPRRPGTATEVPTRARAIRNGAGELTRNRDRRPTSGPSVCCGRGLSAISLPTRALVRQVMSSVVRRADKYEVKSKQRPSWGVMTVPAVSAGMAYTAYDVMFAHHRLPPTSTELDTFNPSSRPVHAPSSLLRQQSSRVGMDRWHVCSGYPEEAHCRRAGFQRDLPLHPSCTIPHTPAGCQFVFTTPIQRAGPVVVSVWSIDLSGTGPVPKAAHCAS